MASRCEEQQEDISLCLIRPKKPIPELSMRQVDEEFRIYNGSGYCFLTALVEKGLAQLENFKKHCRNWQYAYLLTPKSIREQSLIPHRFIELRCQNFDDLRVEIELLEREPELEPPP